VNTVIGLIGGPLLGLFFLGMFTQGATTQGALLGCLAGFVGLLSILPVSKWLLHHREARTRSYPSIWFSLFGCLITMGVGLLTSRATP